MRSLEVFWAFLRLGLSAFGGPIAHVGYFRREFVERRRWLDGAEFAQLLAISQFLPGPASSQLGFSIGLLRAGWRGALAAFVAFTLPSALLLFALSYVRGSTTSTLGAGLTHGLKLAAVAVVAHGVVRMARQMTPDLSRAMIGVAAAALTLCIESAWTQVLTIVGGAAAGLLLPRRPEDGQPVTLPVRHGRRAAILAAATFALGLAAALAWPTRAPALGSVAAAFWETGALVFGGGHVVLPLLDRSVVATGWVSQDLFLVAYGAAQAIPGPMFSIAAFLGALVPTGESPALGALVATLCIFAPGFLLVVAVLPVWRAVTQRPRARQAVVGVNAAVVGLLAAALIDPVIPSAVADIADVVVAAIGLALLWDDKRSALWAVGWCVLAGGLVAAF